MSAISEVIRNQRQWAALESLDVDQFGYLAALAKNLRQPLSLAATKGFDGGSGGELKDTPERPAKMRALHSSAALAVNVFDYWTDRDAGPLAAALGQEEGVICIEFEKQFPTGLGGNPPNLDVVLRLASGMTIAIESKFTEWMTSKSSGKEHFRPAYFSCAEGTWNRVGLLDCQNLADGIKSGSEQFRYLDAPQLLKHALGLARGLPDRFALYYLYYDWPGAESEAHSAEIRRFADSVGKELQFQCLKYQDLFCHLSETAGGENSGYLDYLRGRYFRQMHERTL